MSKRDVKDEIEDFFKTDTKPVKKRKIATRTVTERTGERTPERSNVGTNDRGRTRTVIDEIKNPTKKRRTERYSFEIYTDQKDTIEDLARDYYNNTGKLLNKSEIIRLALDNFINENLKDI